MFKGTPHSQVPQDCVRHCVRRCHHGNGNSLIEGGGKVGKGILPACLVLLDDDRVDRVFSALQIVVVVEQGNAGILLLGNREFHDGS